LERGQNITIATITKIVKIGKPKTNAVANQTFAPKLTPSDINAIGKIISMVVWLIIFEFTLSHSISPQSLFLILVI
jgi:hypothetical protein